MINLLQLRAFHTVATHGSFTKAAKILHVTQPTLSSQVKELEQRHGLKLFYRKGCGVGLSGAGEPELDTGFLGSNRLAIIAPVNHALARHEVIALRSIDKQALIIRKSDQSAPI